MKLDEAYNIIASALEPQAAGRITREGYYHIEVALGELRKLVEAELKKEEKKE